MRRNWLVFVVVPAAMILLLSACERAEKPGESPQGSPEAAAEAEEFPSGLIIQRVERGSGASPGEADTVVVHYHGTFPDGRVFDSSIDRGIPAVFPVNGVIACWTEALQHMKVGAKAHLTCPAAIAYGEAGAPPTIPPDATLQFAVELLEVR